MKDGSGPQSGRQWKARPKYERAVFDRVDSEHGRRIALGCVHREDRGPPAAGRAITRIPAVDLEAAAIHADGGSLSGRADGQQERGYRNSHYGNGTVRRSREPSLSISISALASSNLSSCCTPLKPATVSYGTPVTSVCAVMG